MKSSDMGFFWGFLMIMSGISILNADGLHEDGWCWPRVALHAKAEGTLNELRIGVWLKPEEGVPDLVALTVSIDKARPLTRYIGFDKPTELSFLHKFHEGQEISIELQCDHRVLDKGEDQRDLSFMFMSLVAM